MDTMKLISMKRSPKSEKPTNKAEVAGPSDAYPYGLQLRLENDSIEKLDIELPKVGSTVTVMAKAKVTSVSQNESNGSGKRRSIELQLTDLCIDAAAAKPSPAESLYDKKK
jgi:hypothetical protein